MIINCQNCNTKYLVADESIGSNGRNVKCIKCSNIWFERCQIKEENENNQNHSNLNDSSLSEMTKNIEFNNNHVPVVIKNKSYILYISLIIIILLISASATLMYSSKMKDVIPNFLHNKLGNNFEIKNVNFNSKANQEIVNFSVVNHSIKAEKIKKIIISFADDEKNIIKSYLINCDIEIQSQSEYQVNQLLDNNIKKTNLLIIDIKS